MNARVKDCFRVIFTLGMYEKPFSREEFACKTFNPMHHVVNMGRDPLKNIAEELYAIEKQNRINYEESKFCLASANRRSVIAVWVAILSIVVSAAVAIKGIKQVHLDSESTTTALVSAITSLQQEKDKLVVNEVDFWATRSLPSNNGYTWTLTSRIGHMLKDAEQCFGPRDSDWTILGVEKCMDQGAVPQNWYPDYPLRKNIVFQIVSAEDEKIACYQLAHEVVHSLSPMVEKRANVLEEGAATWFARKYVKDNFDFDINNERGSYRHARLKVEQLLSTDSQAIVKLRKVEPCFKKMTAETFKTAGVTCPPETVIDLLLEFVR